MKQLLVILIFVSTVNHIYSQNTDCKVLFDSLKGTYAGECQNGKANGTGKAVGIDSYEGQFVDGYPEGKGVYTWKDGHYYIGQFKKGKIHGTGEMYYESSRGEDSLIRGYWEKGKYKGLYEKPYIIHHSTTNLSEINCNYRNRNKNESTIAIESFRVSSEGTTYRNSGGVQPAVNNIVLTQGGYKGSQSIYLANSASTILLNAVFPFRATIYLNGGEYFEISLLEKADYDIRVRCR